VKKLNIILPVYNEAAVIEDFNKELFKVLNKITKRYRAQVLYVVDKSSDDTFEILSKIARKNKHVRAILLSKRFGHQMSIVAGIDNSDCDCLIMMDCDLEHPPQVILKLLEQYERGYDVVNTKRSYNNKISLFKKLSSKLFYKILSKLANVDITADSADFRLISNKVIKVWKEGIREQNQFLRGLFSFVGFRQTSVEFVSETRKKGVSKYNLKKLINFATIGIVSFSKIPLQISIGIGILFSFLSIGYGVFSIVVFFMDSQLPQGWTSLIATILFIGGMQLITLGVIGEYVGAIFDEVKKRPLYIIEEEVGAKKNV
jgi:polyisoprenyl-phosphate glycosyltransferase